MNKTQSSPEGIQSINFTKDKGFKDYWFSKLYKKLYTNAVHFFRNDQGVDDVVNDFYFKLYKWDACHFHQKSDEEISNYIFAAFKKFCIDVWRKRKRKKLVHETIGEAVEEQNHTKSSEQLLSEQEDYDAILRLLTPEQREVVLLRDEGRSHQEIAHILNITPTVSTSRINRAGEKITKKKPSKARAWVGKKMPPSASK